MSFNAAPSSNNATVPKGWTAGESTSKNPFPHPVPVRKQYKRLVNRHGCGCGQCNCNSCWCQCDDEGCDLHPPKHNECEEDEEERGEESEEEESGEGESEEEESKEALHNGTILSRSLAVDCRGCGCGPVADLAIDISCA